MKLTHCIKHLGLSLGWRYWRISRRAQKNPMLVLEWARDSRHQAIISKTDKEFDMWIKWAEALEKSYLDYVNAKP